MSLKKYKFLIGAMMIIVLTASACVPGVSSSSSEPGQADPGSNQIQNSGGGASAPSTGETGIQEQQGGEQSAPGEGVGKDDSMNEQQAPSARLIEYADSTDKFKISYPDNFVFRRLPAEKFAQLEPKPEAVFTITSPDNAGAEQAGIGPGDVEIRTYPSNQANLENWLTAAKLLTADAKGKPFKTSNVSGIEVCSSTMLFPGCSYFFLGNGWIYQLIPATLEGETMLKSFILTK
jgi:hypothetical protein